MNRSNNSMIELAYLGPAGSHSHQAALCLVELLLSEELIGKVELIPYPSLNKLIEAVDSGQIASGLLPVENALEGSVMESIEALGAKKEHLDIVLEFSHPVVHCLIQNNKQNEAPVKLVMSHPQALGQCREELKKAYGDALEKEVTSSTSEAVRLLETADDSTAAIGTKGAAEIYGMTVIRDDISDSPDNATRFMLIASAKKPPKLSLEQTKKKHPVKTFLCMGMKDRSGVLVDMLLVLKAYGVNMTRIESRPNRQKVGNYRFFIDVENDLELPEYERVKMYLEADTDYLKVLGPYYSLGKL